MESHSPLDPLSEPSDVKAPLESLAVEWHPQKARSSRVSIFLLASVYLVLVIPTFFVSVMAVFMFDNPPTNPVELFFFWIAFFAWASLFLSFAAGTLLLLWQGFRQADASCDTITTALLLPLVNVVVFFAALGIVGLFDPSRL